MVREAAKPIAPTARADELQVNPVTAAELPDYYPPIRAGAVKADADGNLWVLPATSAQSKAGELVYDVISTEGELFERVRLPIGRSIAGFGKGGVVYLMVLEGSGNWELERTHVLRSTTR